jgi:hypothetical protein
MLFHACAKSAGVAFLKLRHLDHIIRPTLTRQRFFLFHNLNKKPGRKEAGRAKRTRVTDAAGPGSTGKYLPADATQ